MSTFMLYDIPRCSLLRNDNLNDGIDASGFARFSPKFSANFRHLSRNCHESAIDTLQLDKTLILDTGVPTSFDDLSLSVPE